LVHLQTELATPPADLIDPVAPLSLTENVAKLVYIRQVSCVGLDSAPRAWIKYE
jgi:hypothetical protein